MKPLNKKNNNSIFSLPILGNWLVYAPLHSISAIVNLKALNKLKEGEEIKNQTKFHHLVKSLNEQVHLRPTPLEKVLDPIFLGIIPTRACNISCNYCGFGADHASHSTMKLETAKTAVDWMIQQTLQSGKANFKIHFFGGEPFLAWDIILFVVHYARSQASKRGLLPNFEASTNGVFDDNKAGFIGDYFDTIVLSFDGPPRLQNLHRPMKPNSGSFDAVSQTAIRLKKYPVKLCFRMCVSDKSVHHLEETVKWFCETYEPVAISVETLQPNSRSTSFDLNPPDPFEFASQFIKAREIAESYGVDVIYAADISHQPKTSFCPVGKDAVIVSTEGQANACYLLEEEWKAKGMDMKVGHFSSQGEVNINLQAMRKIGTRIYINGKERCKNCFCKWSCAGGCHVNHSFPGCSTSYSNFCIQTRIISACSLLKQMDQNTLVEKIIDNSPFMKSIANQESDLLSMLNRVNQ